MASAPLEVFWADDQMKKLDKFTGRIKDVDILIDSCFKTMTDISALCLEHGIVTANDKSLQSSAEALNKLVNVLSDYELYLQEQRDALTGRLQKCIELFGE